MIHDTIPASLVPVPVFKFHGILACIIITVSIIPVCVIYRQPHEDAKQVVTRINLLTVLFDVSYHWLVLGELTAYQMDWPSMLSIASFAFFEAKLTSSVKGLRFFSEGQQKVLLYLGQVKPHVYNEYFWNIMTREMSHPHVLHSANVFLANNAKVVDHFLIPCLPTPTNAKNPSCHTWSCYNYSRSARSVKIHWPW